MSEWKEITLGEIVTFQRGHDLPQTEFEGGEYPIISSYGILGYHNKYTTLKDGVTIGRSGNSIGKPFYIESNFWAHNTTLYVKKFHNSYPKFVFYLLKTINFRALDSGSAVPSLNRNYIHPLPLSIPEYLEQKRIANVLSCLDAKIENLRRQNETLEQIAQTLFKHWFIDFEFPNADGKPYKSSGGAIVALELGEIPDGWRVGKLGDEFEIIMGQSPAGSSFNEDKQGMVFFQGRTDFGFRFPTVRLYTTEPTRIAEKFDVLVSVRAPVGDINVACEKCCIGRGLAAIKSKYKSYCLHKLKSYRKFFNVFESEGTVFGSITKQSFNNLASVIPTDKVIKEFESLVKTIDQKFYINDLQIQTLTKTRDALLPKLMNGQLRVDM